MQWSIKKSEALKVRIAKNEGLMKELSNAVANVFKTHGIELKGKSYVFEPRVFTIRAAEAHEAKMRSREAMVKAITEYFINKTQMVGDFQYLGKCIPECGGMDPVTLKMLDKFRLIDRISDDPIPVVDSLGLMRRMVGNKALMAEFSQSVFKLLEQHGITFKENEGCVFTPMVFETPIYAQQIGKAKSLSQIQGFGPQVFADPTPQPAFPASRFQIMFKPLAGIIAVPWGRTPGVIIPPWWWIGIPAPEMLKALDMMRNV